MTVEETRNRGGRPRREGGPDPVRTAGRIGALWDEAAATAKAAGMTMTAFVEEALRREIRRRKRSAAVVRRAAGEPGP